jgi:FkbM family methyltransferase
MVGLLEKIKYKEKADSCIATIGKNVVVDKFEAVFNAANCKIEIADNIYFKELKIYLLANNTTVKIGTGTRCNNSFWANLSGSNTSVIIGQNCLLADVRARTSDPHHLIDMETGEKINKPASILVGNHVWIADDVLLLKGAKIGDGAAIGPSSLVNNSVPQNSFAIGAPAKVEKTNVEWRFSKAQHNPTIPAAPSKTAEAKTVKNTELASKAPQSAKRDEVLAFWQVLQKNVSKKTVTKGDQLLQTWEPPEANERPEVSFLRDLTQNSHQLELKGGLFRFLSYFDFVVQLEEIVFRALYNFETQKENPLIIDAGSCYGLASYQLQRLHPGAEILAFEPNPENAKVIRENIINTRLTGVALNEAAVGARNDTVSFHTCADMPMGSSVSDRMSKTGYETEVIEVRQMSLPEILKGRDVDFLKLDIEGGEYELLDALDGQLDNVQNIFIEIHFGAEYSKDKFIQLQSVLHKNRFDFTISRANSKKVIGPLIDNNRKDWNTSLNLWANKVLQETVESE